MGHQSKNIFSGYKSKVVDHEKLVLGVVSVFLFDAF